MARRAHLRAVPPRPSPPRRSVVVDLTRSQRMTPPLTAAEMLAMSDAPGSIPVRVFVAMWIAAWARAEDCPLHITAGRLEPYCRYEPSDDLWVSVGQAMGSLVGALVFAVPLMFSEAVDRGGVATWASWPSSFQWGVN